MSPKEVFFLKELLAEFSPKEIKEKLKECYERAIPPAERPKSPLTRCRGLFKKPKGLRGKPYSSTENWRVKTLEEKLKNLSPEERKRVVAELKGFFKGKKPSPQELEEVLKLVLKKYNL